MFVQHHFLGLLHDSTTDGLTPNIMVLPTGILYYEAQQYHRNDAMQFPAFYWHSSICTTGSVAWLPATVWGAAKRFVCYYGLW